MIEQRPIERSEQDIRSQVTGKIWGTATGMLGICIPLAALSHMGGPIAMVVALSAGLGTVAVWMRGGTVVVNSRGGADELASQKRIQELEERLASLESITNFEHKLIEAKYPNATPIAAPAAPAFSLVTPPVSPSGGVMSDSGVQASSSAGTPPLAQSG